MEKFLRRSWRSRLALAVTAGILAAGYIPQAMAAPYTTAITAQDSDSATFGSVMSTDAAGNKVYTFSEGATFNMKGGSAIGVGKVVPLGAIVNGDLNITSHGKKYSATGISAGYFDPDFNKDGTQRASLIINGNVTMRDKAVVGEWGITSKNVHGGYSEYTSNRWEPVAIKAGLAGDITINGNVDIAVKGTGLATDPYYTALNVNDYGLSTITLNGNVNIETPEDVKDAFYSIANYGGTINVNTDGSTAGNNKVTLKGNMLTMGEDADGSGGDFFYRDGRTNVALTTKDSSWSGVVDNTGAAQTGEINLWLQNNAVWNHQAMSKTDGIFSGGLLPNPSDEHYGPYDGITHINKLAGGTTAANAGLLYQKDKANIDIKNYSGYTTVFYEHTNDGTDSNHYAAGDVIIGAADKGSQITLVTANNGVDTKNNNTVNKVLNTLAGKLTYSDYKNNPDNLKGKVEIAGGLTADRVELASNNIVFDETGKGGTASGQSKTNFNTILTGDASVDKEYVSDSIRQEDGSYKFTKDSTIEVELGSKQAAINPVKGMAALKVDANGQDLNIKVQGKNADQVFGIMNDLLASGSEQLDKTVSVDAKKVSIQVENEKRAEGIHVQGYKYWRPGSVAHQAAVNIKGDVNVNASGSEYALGIYANNGANVNIDGNLTMKGENGSWGVQNKNNTATNGAQQAWFNTSGIYAAGNGSAGVSKVTVNGDTDIAVDGTGVVANICGSEVNLNGATNIKINDKTKDFEGQGVHYAIVATEGTVNVNMNDSKDGAADHKVNIYGNVGTDNSGIVTYYGKFGSKINMGLATKDSEFTGVVSKNFTDKNIEDGYDGTVNMYLSNGATWNNEIVGNAVNGFAGSRVTKLAGGASAEQAGNIYQKDSKALTIDNYSGHTNIFYEHAGDGVTYNAGDTIIKHAEQDSKVNLITSSKGLTISAESISKTLNALAGKLTYSNYVSSERNLNATAQIAGGLTSDSVTMAAGNIVFDASGKGSGIDSVAIPNPPTEQESTSFGTVLTGDKDKDLEYVLAGVRQEDGSYKFTKDSTIEVELGSKQAAINPVKGMAALKVDANGQDLNIKVQGKNADQVFGIMNDLLASGSEQLDKTVSVDAKKVSIQVENEKRAEGIHVQGYKYWRPGSVAHQAAVNIKGDVNVNASGSEYALGIYANNGANVNIDGNLTMKGENGSWGVQNKNNTATNGAQQAWFNTSGIYAAGNGSAGVSKVTVNGDTDIAVDGTGVVANICGSEVNLNGATNIKINDKTKDFEGQGVHYAIVATEGTVNVNMNDSKDGAADHKVNIYGNVGTDNSGIVTYYGKFGSKINMGLATKDSEFTGVVSKNFTDKNIEDGYDGTVNMYLSNGATWNNEIVGNAVNGFAGSRVTKLAGGASAEQAGYIYQKDSKALTIDNYSGHTNIFYAHDNDGTKASDFDKYGDTIIKHAEADSKVNLITNSAILSDAEKVGSILSNLAGKLTYSNYANNERNLTGTAQIAGGLTSDSVTWALSDIVFDENGKGGTDGTFKIPDAPDHQVAETFNNMLTGNQAKDLEYVLGGVRQEDGSYKFIEDTEISIKEKNTKVGTYDYAVGVRADSDIAIDASGKDLKLTINPEAGVTASAIFHESNKKNDITAENLIVKATSTARAEGIHANSGTADKAETNINANADITVEAGTAIGAYAAGNGEINFNGDVKIKTISNSSSFYAVSGLYAGSNYSIQKGGTINVNGAADISGDGAGAFANGGGSTINFNGDTLINATKDGMPALMAQSGTINVNMPAEKLMRSSNVVQITGNAVAGTGSAYGTEPETKSVININLDNKRSYWNGLAYNQFPEAGISAGGKTFTGDINLYLSNSAVWTNEKQGELPTAWGGEAFTGSRISNFVGGKDYSSSGYIFQKDSQELTINNYSGSTILVYDHGDTNGTDVADYAAGNTKIKNAAEGSLITLSTSSKNINVNDSANVESVMNALAQKLYYANAGVDTNLKGQVQIAGGLTSDSLAMYLGDMKFDAADAGKGTYEFGTAHKTYTQQESELVNVTRTAMMSNMLSWRNVAGDSYNRRAMMLDDEEAGVWARTYGGQTKYSGNNTSFNGSYWAGQVGYDMNLANGWNLGVAFDYQDGNDTYQNGSGDTKLYTLGFYGSTALANAGYLDVNAKIGHVKNEFKASNASGTLNGDYSATGYSLSAQYGKRFGDIKTGYFEPQMQLTWSRLGSADYTASAGALGSVNVNQDAFNSFVARVGLEAGQASEHGNYYARLNLMHEFSGDVNTHLLDSAGGTKNTSYDLKGTWSELTLGGTYNLSKCSNFYADITKTLTGDYKQDWKVNAGLRFTF